MTKYVIHNCPNIRRDGLCTENSLVVQKCKNNEKCLLKQINERCKSMIDKFNPSCRINPYSLGRCISAECISEMLEVDYMEDNQ